MLTGLPLNAMEELANRLGLPAEQVMVPLDAVLDGTQSNLPCIAVVLLPNRLTHFIVIWRRLLGWVQVMDPAQGRIWVREAELNKRLYEHKIQVSADAWREYAQGQEFADYLLSAGAHLSLTSDFMQARLTAARSAPDAASVQAPWQALADLDAALRCARANLSKTAWGLPKRSVGSRWSMHSLKLRPTFPNTAIKSR